MPFVEKRSILPADGCSRKGDLSRVFFDAISAAVQSGSLGRDVVGPANKRRPEVIKM